MVDVCDVAAQLAADGVEVHVDVVGFQVDAEAREQLACIADATGGDYVDADDGGALADSLTRLSLRALRVLEVGGEPVDGTVDRADAPLLTTGTYRDTVTTVEPVWYAFDQRVDEWLWLATVVPRQADRVPGGERLTLRTDIGVGAGGGSGRPDSICGLDVAVHFEEDNELDAAALEAPTERAAEGDDPSCRMAGRRWARLVIESRSGELGLEVPVELRLVAAVPTTSDRPDDLGARAAPPRTGDVRAGGSPGTAPLIGRGTTTDTLRSGEVVYYAVDVAEGQRLSVDGTVRNATSDRPLSRVILRVLSPTLESTAACSRGWAWWPSPSWCCRAADGLDPR